MIGCYKKNKKIIRENAREQKKENPRFKLTGLDPLVNWAEDCKSVIDNMKCPPGLACVAWWFYREYGFVGSTTVRRSAPISSRFLCPRPPLLLSAPNQNHSATQATPFPGPNSHLNASNSVYVKSYGNSK